MITKSENRKKYSKIRASIDDKIRDAENKIIKERLLNTDEYKRAETVFAYVSYSSEVDTKEIIKQMFSDGKRVAVPLCNTEAHTMRVVLIDGLHRLKKGAYGIEEPDTAELECGKLEELSAADVDFAIVPGLCFDKHGNRLGYGGGYYDRFLEIFKGFSVGLAFSDSMTDLLETEEHDCRVDCVIHPGKRR